MKKRSRAPGKADILVMTLFFVIAAVVRLSFVSQVELPHRDPWRHLQLVENLREGLGFTLLDGQPYLWYSPVWYSLCAALPGWVDLQIPAAILSMLSVVLFYLWLFATAGERARVVSAAGSCSRCSGRWWPSPVTMDRVVRSGHDAGRLPPGREFPSSLGRRHRGAALRDRDRFPAEPRLQRRPLSLRDQDPAAEPGDPGRDGGPVRSELVAEHHSIIQSFPYVFTWDGLATEEITELHRFSSVFGTLFFSGPSQGA